MLALLALTESPTLKLLTSIGVLTAAVVFAVVYLNRPWEQDGGGALGGHRPWRKLGAGIFVVLAVTFVLGIYILDLETPPKVYAIYWLIFTGLLGWLCVLALRDLMYTRKILQRYREGKINLDGSARNGSTENSEENDR